MDMSSIPFFKPGFSLITIVVLTFQLTFLIACENSRPSSLPARVAFRVKDVCDLPPKIPY